MIRITSANELLDSFRSIDRAEVEIPREFTFPMLVKDYLAWTEPSGSRVFLVFKTLEDRAPFGLVFRRDQDSGGAGTRMCEWCHSVRGSGEIRLLTAAASAHRRVGIQLCADLDCNKKVEGLPSAHDFPRNAASAERIRQIIRRMSSFTRQNLF